MTMAAFQYGDPVMAPYDVGANAFNVGDVVVVGDLAGVFHVKKPEFAGAPTLGAVAIGGGAYAMTADSANYEIGTYLYWDPTNLKVTAQSGGQCIPFGWLVGFATGYLSDTTGSTAVVVFHDPTDDTGLWYNLGAAASDVVTNVAAETAFATTTTIPANALQAGDVIHVRVTGTVVAQNSTNTNTIKLKIQTAAGPTFTIVVTTGAVNAAAGTVFIIEGDLVFTAIGATGSFYFVGDMAFGATGTATRAVEYLAATAINTTEGIQLEVTCTQSAQSAGNQTQLLELGVQKNRK